MDISNLEARYLDSCRRHKFLPNIAVLSWLCEVKVQKSFKEKSSLTVLLNQLKDNDIPPLHDLCMGIKSSHIDAVDILCESTCILNEEHILSLLRAVGPKLQIVDLRNILLQEDFLRYLCYNGLPCHSLSLSISHIRLLNMVGSFMQLRNLNLDFSTSISSLHKDCFSCMPNLRSLSMCETRIVDLWTTTAALSKLQSLVELRFQNCLCCKVIQPHPPSFGEKVNNACEKLSFVEVNMCSFNGASFTNSGDAKFRSSRASDTSGDSVTMLSKHSFTTDNLSDASDVNVSSFVQRLGFLEISSVDLPKSTGQEKWQNSEVQHNGVKSGATASRNYNSHHPSPICFERHYREYMITLLPHLNVLDNMVIRQAERDRARFTFAKYFEYLAYKRKDSGSVVSILQNREMGAGGFYLPNVTRRKHPYPCGRTQYSFPRSLSASKLGSASWPLLDTLSSSINICKVGKKRLRTRQFEYHPSDSSLMGFGTLDGEVVVVNHENGKIVGYIPSMGTTNSVLGLCWLKRYPSKLLAGSDDGCLKLFDIHHMLPRAAEMSCSTGVVTFDNFEQLTSVHVNSTDDQFLASGYSKNVALYDINSGKRLQLFTNMHQEPINVAKFAHHSPFIFATSSFDCDVKLWDLRQKPELPCYTATSSRGNVMVCFSPDDLYLLVSAVDNEVKQLLTADGRLHMNFGIASTGSAHNYTRSYYMNGRDYIISGSSDEQIVRICCTQTGRRLRDVYLEDIESGNSLFVQSLRGDPYRLFHFSVLTTTKRLSSDRDIIKVNLLASRDESK